MAQRDRDNHTGRNLALLGGAALLCWLLLRGKGWGLGSGDGVGLGGAGQAKGIGGDSGNNNAPAVVEVWVRSGDRIELNRVSSDLATVVARAHAASEVRLHIAGDARHGWVEDVRQALRSTGVQVLESRG